MKKGTYRLLDFSVRGDERGSLVALEGLSAQIPFDIKRVYYIFGTTAGMVRGKHAHYCLKQVLVCVSGQCDIEVFDGQTKNTIHMDSPRRGLLLDGFIWREMKNFSQGCVLIVLASEHYDEKDYVRSYEQFLKEVKEL